LQDNVHGAANAILHQQLGRSESLFVSQLIGDDRLACAQGEAARRCKVIPMVATPTTPDSQPTTGADQQAFLCRNVLENLAKLASMRRPSGARRVQQLIEARALKGRHPSSASSFCCRMRRSRAGDRGDGSTPLRLRSTIGVLSFSDGSLISAIRRS